MKLPIEWTRAAAVEFDDAVAWYESEQPGTGARLRDAVHNTIMSIRDHPRVFPVVHHAVRRAYVKVFPYSVMYSIESASIRIIAVFHGSRNPSEWQSRI